MPIEKFSNLLLRNEFYWSSVGCILDSGPLASFCLVRKVSMKEGDYVLLAPARGVAKFF